MKLLTVVPARSGSVRIKDKNITPLRGKSLIHWAANIAEKLPGHAVASVDTQQYVDIAKDAGLEVTGLRPASLAGPDVTSMDLWQYEFIRTEEALKTHFDYTVLLEPTCPLRTLDDVERTIAAALQYGAACTVSKVKIPPEKYLQIDGDGILHLTGETRSHLLPTYYLRNGAAYVCSRDDLMAGMPRAFPVIIDRPILSIDEPVDLQICEALLERQQL